MKILKRMISNPWCWFALVVIAVTVCATKANADLASQWTASGYRAVPEAPYCDADLSRPLPDSLTGHMVFEYGVIVASDTIWTEAKTWDNWTVDSVYTEPIPTDIPPGVYYTRVRAFLKDPENIRRDPCWSNVAQVVIRDTCPGNKITDLMIIELP